MSKRLFASLLATAVRNIGFVGGETNTSGALKELQSVQFQQVNGDRPGVPNVAILITDGIANVDVNETIPSALSARAAGIDIIVVGITNQTDENEIRSISSLPQQRNQNYFLSVDFANLDTEIRSTLVRETCTTIPGL